jgi:mRNA-degrading endonuclease toxin of MazEF toxin-antitoxin module
MNYEVGDVLLVRFPRSGGYGTKQRPALVILDIGDADLVVAPITSAARHGPGDYNIQEWSASGLLRASWVRLAKLTAIEKGNVIQYLGRISEADSANVASLFRSLYSI